MTSPVSHLEISALGAGDPDSVKSLARPAWVNPFDWR